MKAEKRRRKQYDDVFKRDAVALVTEQGYKLSEAGRRLGINPNLISRWKRELEPDPTGQRLIERNQPSLNSDFKPSGKTQ